MSHLTNPQLGLTKESARQKLLQVGYNEIQREKKKALWILLIEQFKSPLVLILIFACLLSATLGEWVEAAAIAAILLLNAMIGFIQEYRAENAIAALRNMTAPRARVIRDGNQMIIPSREVVPGDILLLEAGDLVAADGDIIESAHLQINEALLTGESLPVSKSALMISGANSSSPVDRPGTVFMGTTVSEGTATVTVSSIGMNTELGKIAHLITSAETTLTPLQIQLKQVGKTLLALCLFVVAIVAVIGFLQEKSWLDLIVFSISLAVAAVPEGMPAIVTVALALGVQRMAARNALVRKLPSVETLGSVSVICTDKTGTLTTGNMRVREVWGESHQQVLIDAASCCDAELARDNSLELMEGTGDPTELAILIAARERGIEKEKIEKDNPRVETYPFDSDRKRMSIFRMDQNLYVKGAFDGLVTLCSDSEERLNKASLVHEEMTSRGLRVLAVAVGKTPSERDLKLIGLIGFADPPRPEVAASIREARTAGILPVMITGDHPKTAIAIARELGLVLDGDSAEGLVHARVSPKEKLKFVRDWKSKGKIVAMTGDGVNDAPALREAHIGIAMGKTGTEVTRESADLVLADDNFSTIIAAVREGRGIYQNIRKAITYLLTGNFAELMSVLIASLLGLPLPFLAVHLLWINLVTDALPGLALIADPSPPGIMNKPPRPTKEPILGKSEWIGICTLGIIEASVVIALYHWSLQHSNVETARNLAFVTLVFSQLFRSFGARSKEDIFWKVGVFSNLWLLAVVAMTGFLQISLHYIPFTQEIFGLRPLSLRELIIVFVLALIPITLAETYKLLKLIRRKRT